MGQDAGGKRACIICVVRVHPENYRLRFEFCILPHFLCGILSVFENAISAGNLIVIRSGCVFRGISFVSGGNI